MRLLISMSPMRVGLKSGAVVMLKICQGMNENEHV